MRDASVKDFVSVVLAVDQRLVSGGDVDVRHGRENQREKREIAVAFPFWYSVTRFVNRRW